MARLTGTYDPNAEAQQDYIPIPGGEYLAQITDSDMKPTKNNDGEYLELEYTIIEGDYAGRKVWTRLNLQHKSDKVVEIANRQFAAVREATGILAPTDSAQLHNRPHVIRVEFIPAGTTQKNGYVTQRDANEVRGWRKAEGVAAAPAAPAPKAGGAAPWKRAG